MLHPYIFLTEYREVELIKYSSLSAIQSLNTIIEYIIEYNKRIRCNVVYIECIHSEISIMVQQYHTFSQMLY